MKTKFLLATVALTLCAAISPASAATLIVNGGFDDVSVSAATGSLVFPYANGSNYVYPGAPGGFGTVGGWTYTDGTPGGGGGLVGYPPSGGIYFGGPAPLSGSQYAFLQDNGSISQTFSSLFPGTTTISWYEAGRTNNGGGENYEVLLNGSVIGTYSTYASQPWTLETITATLLPGINANTLEFLGTSVYNSSNGTNDVTAFLENVSAVPAIISAVPAVPEPSTWAMMILGFCGLGFMAYRRKARPAFMAA